jgi:hypothetical protein
MKWVMAGAVRAFCYIKRLNDDRADIESNRHANHQGSPVRLTKQMNDSLDGTSSSHENIVLPETKVSMR